jgi:hypothetical protein
MSTKIFAISTFTLKEGATIEPLVKIIKDGITDTSSKNDGFVASSVYTSADGKTVVNFSEWDGDINLFMANHQKNESNSDYKNQIAEVEKLATFAPMAYFKVFEYEK